MNAVERGTLTMMTDVTTSGIGDAEPPPTPAPPDDEATWLVPLAGTGPTHEAAVRRLHELLLRAARHEVRRRAHGMGLAGSSDLDDIAMQSADDALIAILGRLDTFERRSAFTTWAYKFAIHIAGVSVRKLAWQGREVPAAEEALATIATHLQGPAAAAEQHELLREVVRAIGTLTPRQREVVLALCVSGVPIDVLAERLGSTRGAIYKCLHDARRHLRAQTTGVGHD
jgi:RNA polymerase sigma-70 factor (ECF subfamily)